MTFCDLPSHSSLMDLSGLKCPCCDNPWHSLGGENSFSLSCEACVEVSDKTGVDPDNLDPTVSARENFYIFCNGGWLKKNPIPDEYPAWNTFTALHDQNLTRLKGMLDELKRPADGVQATSIEGKVAAFWAAANDEEAVEAAGIDPLQPALDACALAATDKSACVAKLHSQFGVNVFFSVGETVDNKDSERSILAFGQAGLGLPDRDYYFDEDKADKRALYVEHVAKMLELLGGPTATPEAAAAGAAAVMKLETALAAAHMTRTESREPETRYNPMSLTKLEALCKGGIEWPRFLELVGKKEPGKLFTVSSPPALANAARLLHETPADELQCYLRWHVVHACAKHLPKAFVDEDFRFFSQALQGQKSQKPRWKRALGFVDMALGEAVGQLYVERFFKGDAKERALAMVEAVRLALEARLTELPWLGAATKQRALAKMAAFKTKIGFPERWIDYTSMAVASGGAHLSLVFAGHAFQHAREMAFANAPTDRTRWHMLPHQINAYYHPSLNEIVFPAAILQPPFFDPAADDAVNFGAMGAVVGHEMTHGFDDQGRKYDAKGNLEDWWTPEDSADFEKRVAVQVEQAGAYEVHANKLNGKLTCGENIADLGGLKLAYRALQTKLARERRPPPRNGFTAEQRFFLAWAQAWRQNITEERAKMLVSVDPHGPNEFRANGPLTNLPEFHEAFGVNPGDKMWREPGARVDIW